MKIKSLKISEAVNGRTDKAMTKR